MEDEARNWIKVAAESLVVLATIPSSLYAVWLLVFPIQLDGTYARNFSGAVYEARLIPVSDVIARGILSILEMFTGSQQAQSVMFCSIVLGAVVLISVQRLSSEVVPSANKKIAAHVAELKAPKGVIDSINTQEDMDAVLSDFDREKQAIIDDVLTTAASKTWWGRAFKNPIVLAFCSLAGILTAVSDLFFVSGWRQVFADYFAVIPTTVAIAILVIDRLHQKPQWWLRGLIIAYVGALLSAAIVGGISSPQFPTVEMADSAHRQIIGKLLTHSNGYWYVFDSNNRLMAMRDDVETVVTISP